MHTSIPSCFGIGILFRHRYQAQSKRQSLHTQQPRAHKGLQNRLQFRTPTYTMPTERKVYETLARCTKSKKPNQTTQLQPLSVAGEFPHGESFTAVFPFRSATSRILPFARRSIQSRCQYGKVLIDDREVLMSYVAAKSLVTVFVSKASMELESRQNRVKLKQCASIVDISFSHDTFLPFKQLFLRK